jgi:hypothetical protein
VLGRFCGRGFQSSHAALAELLVRKIAEYRTSVVLSYPLFVEKCLCFLLFLCLSGEAQTPSNNAAKAHTTLFTECDFHEKLKRILSPASLSEDQTWQAHVEVNVRGDLGCLYTTRLWVAKASGPNKLVYLMPPHRTASANGMEILGWRRRSSIVLVQTEAWQMGSDALDAQQVLAIDAGNGMVYEPNLAEMMDDRKDKQCMFRIKDAGFRTGEGIAILVRAQISTFYEPGDEEADVAPAKRCQETEETWSFDFDTGEVKRVPNSEPLQAFKKFVSDGHEH